MIILWSGSIATIPTGWVLCDGTNSTPNLRDRFVVGAGTTYAVNGTGGSANATLVSHTHTATVSDPGHAHSYNDPTIGGGISAYISGGQVAAGTTGTAVTSITVSNSTEGASATNANLPPYYALAYIMKT
jgi:microcystin-dependent protein